MQVVEELQERPAGSTEFLQLAECGQAGEKHGEMGFVTVGWVVEIENLGFGGF